MNTAFSFCSDDGGSGWRQQRRYALPGRKGLPTRQAHFDSGQRSQGGKVVGFRRGDRALPGGGATGHGLFMRAMRRVHAGISPASLTRCGAGVHYSYTPRRGAEASGGVASGHARHLRIIMAWQGMLCRVHDHGGAALPGCNVGKSRDSRCKQQAQNAHDKTDRTAGHGLKIPHGGIYSK